MKDRIPGWLRGMNTILPDNALPENTLRDAVNVDIMDNGAARRRAGSTLALPIRGTHSFWSNGEVAYFVAAGNLRRMNDDMTSTVIRANVGDRVMQYEEVNGEVFFVNGLVTGRIRDGVVFELGVELPPVPPELGAAIAGYLHPGAYQSVCTFVNQAGEESACQRSSYFSLPAAGGLTIGLPRPTSPEVAAVRVYLTQPDGDVLYQIQDVPVGQDITVMSAPQFGPVCRTQFMARMFAAEALTFYRGRMYFAAGNVVWFSEPFQFGLTNPSENFMVFGGEVTLMAAVKDGIYIGADKTFFVSGDEPKTAQASTVFPFGAARYSKTNLVRTDDALWYSERGIVVGMDGGNATLLQAENVVPEAHTSGATLVRESNSLSQILSAVSGAPGMASLSAVDFMDAEIIRAKG